MYACEGRDGSKCVLKLHRLGRISFRRVKEKRDYLLHRTTTNWLYLSRLAAEREYQYLTALHAAGLSVPTPLDNSRHVILMEYIDAQPLGQVYEMKEPEAVYSHLVQLAINLANHGLVHSDYNEFNLLYSPTAAMADSITMIDFPQMITTQHPEAAAYFQRDIDCITRFFYRRFQWQPTYVPTFDADVTLLQPGQLIAQDVGGKRRQDGEEGVREEERREFERMMERYIQTGGEQDSDRREASEDDEDEDVGEDIADEQELPDEDDDGTATAGEQKDEAIHATDNSQPRQTEAEADDGGEAADGEVESEDEEDEEEAAFRARMARKEARQQGERMRQQKRNERRQQQQQHPPSSSANLTQQNAAEAGTEETDAQEEEDNERDEQGDRDKQRGAAFNALDAQLIGQIKAKLKRQPASSSSHQQSVSKARNVVKNKKLFKLNQDIESQL